MKQFTLFLFVLLLSIGCFGAGSVTDKKPLMRDFMGMCVHTVQFKPDLYKPICRHVRDYHGLNWDVGDETDFWPVFPFARNKVDWGTMYGQWVDAGYEINASIMFGGLPFEKWKNPTRDAETYGFAFSRFFGPGNRNLVTAMEIGNEPGGFSDKQYRTIFENMAKGIRAGDADMKIVTCAAIAGKSHQYAKSLSCVKGLEDLYDVINVHSYAQVKGWPTWLRSYPEDGSIVYLKDIQDAIDWRNKHAKGKEVWITEFGWDCSTQPAPKDGTFKDWVDNTDIEQARYLVRSWLVFAAMDLDRAYMYWFNDTDTPQVHGAAGLTRNYEPKPSFYATAHLQSTLGNYRFSKKVLEEAGNVYAYEFVNGTDSNKTILAIWSPTGKDRAAKVSIPAKNVKIVKAERMPLEKGEAQKIEFTYDERLIHFECNESVAYFWLE